MKPTRGLMSAASRMSDHDLSIGVPVDAIHQTSGHGPVRDTVTPISRGPEQWSWRMAGRWER